MGKELVTQSMGSADSIAESILQEFLCIASRRFIIEGDARK